MNTAIRLKEESLRRMRWRLWFSFRDSQYSQFKYIRRDGKTEPMYENIKAYCKEHWNKEIKDMDEKELAKYIAIVSKW